MPSPLALLDHRVIVGFHGCDQATADRVLVTSTSAPPTEHEAKTRAWWAGLTLAEQFAFLVEIGIYTADGQLHPNYDHLPENEPSKDAEAK